MTSLRLPRFQRAAEISPIVLTGRDRALIQRVFQHRFLRSTHLLSLTSGSRQQVLRRLHLLYHHAYLDRPRAQIDYYRSGSEPMVYALGNKGMQLLEHDEGIPHRKLDWAARNRVVTRFYLEHTLAVAEILIKVELACRLNGFEFVRCDTETSWKWKVTVHHRGVKAVVGVVPDAVFGIISGNNMRWFLLEADRATMPVQRRTLNQSSFYRKLLAYLESWKQGLLKNSLSRFQVLTVSSTVEHVRNIIEANKRATGGKGSGLFLFADRGTFNAADNVLELPLLNGRGETVTLLS